MQDRALFTELTRAAPSDAVVSFHIADHEHSLPAPAATMRAPFAAIAAVHLCTAHAPPALTIDAPVSPSTPFSAPPLTNQTTASVFPSVVVTTGDVAVASAEHQATVGLIAPASPATENLMIDRPPPPAGQCAALAFNATYVPLAV